MIKLNPRTLYKKLPEVKSFNGFVYLGLVREMMQFMIAQKGIGLAANQIGRETRMFVMNVSAPKACFNPRIIKSSILTESFAEGCLSFKNEQCIIDRPQEIDVEYQDWNGVITKETLKGLEARCFQHELDHLDGITMQKRKKINESTRTIEKELDSERVGSTQQVEVFHLKGYGTDSSSHAQRSVIGNT